MDFFSCPTGADTESASVIDVNRQHLGRNQTVDCMDFNPWIKLSLTVETAYAEAVPKSKQVGEKNCFRLQFWQNLTVNFMGLDSKFSLIHQHFMHIKELSKSIFWIWTKHYVVKVEEYQQTR